MLDGFRQEPIRWRDEALWLPVTLVALVATYSFAHWILHREVIVPVLEAAGTVPGWMVAALYVPELVVCFVTGWRLRGLRTIALYAASGGVLREVFGYFLAAIGEPGHVGRFAYSASELALATPVVAVIYFVVFALAAESAREPGPVPSPEQPDR